MFDEFYFGFDKRYVVLRQNRQREIIYLFDKEIDEMCVGLLSDPSRLKLLFFNFVELDSRIVSHIGNFREPNWEPKCEHI